MARLIEEKHCREKLETKKISINQRSNYTTILVLLIFHMDYLYILDVSEKIYTHLLLYLVLMSKVSENVIPTVFASSSSDVFG